MKDLEEAAEEQNPQGLLAPKSEEDEEDLAGPSSTFGYTYTIPTKGRRILPGFVSEILRTQPLLTVLFVVSSSLVL